MVPFLISRTLVSASLIEICILSLSCILRVFLKLEKWSSRPLPEIEPKGTGIHGLMSYLSTQSYHMLESLESVRLFILGESKKGRHEPSKRIDDFMCGLELKQITKPRDDSIIETYRMGKISC